MKIPFSPPYIDDQVVAEVTDSLRSGWITTGPKVKALEEEIVKLTGTQHALCVNSWTTGAIMMLRWLGVKPGTFYLLAGTSLTITWKTVPLKNCID